MRQTTINIIDELNLSLKHLDQSDDCQLAQDWADDVMSNYEILPEDTDQYVTITDLLKAAVICHLLFNDHNPALEQASEMIDEILLDKEEKL